MCFEAKNKLPQQGKKGFPSITAEHRRVVLLWGKGELEGKGGAGKEWFRGQWWLKGRMREGDTRPEFGHRARAEEGNR